ncbi:hypothetical protein [Cryptosporangium aurantiacum]|uniref:Uncharacterized protein n=1 Tax=Cryptosporangium aurantiacum TaxID=134849 RepID=A0A1M7QMQ5_9ACTN|nr:hypothetical protein [Cryptosporangium aurantiacum]SHN32314.1 hypothetical protein SAMN05443668_10521 [Cryptosporangium aurantiacum]
MIRSEVDALRAAMVRAPLDPAWAPFEAAMLVRTAARPGICRSPGTRPTVHHPRPETWAGEPGLLAEFDTDAAAQRLVSTLAAIAPSAAVDSGYQGGRHRYEIHRVTVAPEAGAQVQEVLTRSASAGATALRTVAVVPAGSAAPTAASRRRRELVIAAAAWRAALLAVGPGRGGPDGLAVRVGDPWSASTLLRAADLLRVPVRAVRRPGGQLLTVDGRTALGALVHVVTGGTGAPVAARVGLVG